MVFTSVCDFACLSVLLLTVESLSLESLFLVCRISTSDSYVTVMRSMSRLQEQSNSESVL